MADGVRRPAYPKEPDENAALDFKGERNASDVRGGGVVRLETPSGRGVDEACGCGSGGMVGSRRTRAGEGVPMWAVSAEIGVLLALGNGRDRGLESGPEAMISCVMLFVRECDGDGGGDSWS